jgi:nicotinamide mononucleotide transporter
MSISPLVCFEAVASLLALGGVAALSRGLRWGWLVATVSSALYGGFAWRLGLWGQVLLNLMFCLTQLWGWRHWQHQPRFRNEPRAHLGMLPALPIGLALQQVWHPADAWLTALSVCAQVLTSLGVRQVWRWWLGIDLGTAALYGSQGAYLTAGLYLLFAWIAESAHRFWKDAEVRG